MEELMSEGTPDDGTIVNPELDWNTMVIIEFRANGGRVSGSFEGAPILLLHTIGAKSGLERVTPMMYLEFEGRLFVFASNAGADAHPDWYHNLRAHPMVTVEIGSATIAAVAAPLEGTERDRIYAVQAERRSDFTEYAHNTSRTIPVIELIRP